MSKKLTYLVSFVLVLGLVLTSVAKAVDPDLAAYWNFDEGSGTTAFDSTGNGNDGIFVGDPKWVPGRLGGALEFDGDDYLNCGNGPSLQIQDAITIAFWFKVDAFQTTWEAFMAKGDNSYRTSRGGGDGNATHMGISGTSVGGGNGWFNGNVIVTGGEWHHMAATYDGAEGKIYIDGVLDVTSPGTGQINISTYELWIGTNSQNTNRLLHGLLDDMRIYSRALRDVEILGIMAGGGAEYPIASGPTPADGSLHEDTWVNLSWRAGDFAVSHDVYFGENFDDVNDSAESTFQGNQTSTFLVAGFPGFPYPEGLVPGTTYYWRIDEVNDTEPNSPWKGSVWSFTVPPRTAYDQIPADGAKFVDPDEDLSWTAGFGAKLHTVYFGDNFDDVNSAAGGLPQGNTTYTLDTLELEKTYYWRVDEFDAINTYKGDVWSFTITRAGGGIKGEYFNNIDLMGIPVLTRIDPQINFYWNPGPNPPPGVNEDNFSVRWTGELEAVFSEPVTFITGSDDGVRLYLDGELIIENWTIHDRTENRSQPIELVAGQTYGIVLEGYEGSGEAEWQLYWQSPSIPRQLIPQAALSPPIKAGNPKPSNGAVDVKQTQILSWSPGENAASHEVYFGTDEEAVRNANTSSPEYKGTRTLGSESYDPGKLEWDTAYYWRVDEVEADGTIQTGNVWSFTTANFLIVDDFEDYDAGENQIWYAWHDGLGFGAPGSDPYSPGNGTGSAVGWDTTPSYTEETIVHSGNQSMPLSYDNSILRYSEATLTLVYPRNWTENGVTTLTIWFRGDASNAAETLYVVLNGSAVVTNDNPDAALVEEWTEWSIDLQTFGVNLANVNTIALGLGNRNNPLAGGSGTMYFDDIRLYPPPPEPEPQAP